MLKLRIANGKRSTRLLELLEAFGQLLEGKRLEAFGRLSLALINVCQACPARVPAQIAGAGSHAE